MRKRDEAYCNALLQVMSEGGRDLREARIEAGRRLGWCWNGGTWSKPMTDTQIVRKAKKIEDRDGSRAMFEYVYDTVGFSKVDAARKLVEHIHGVEYEARAVTKDGEVVEYTAKAKPSLDALKFQIALTTEKQTTKVQVDTRMLVAHRMVSDEPPKMRARQLKAALPPANAPT